MLVMAYVLIISAVVILVGGIATIAYFCTGDRRDVVIVRRENDDFTMYANQALENATSETGTYGANGVFYASR